MLRRRREADSSELGAETVEPWLQSAVASLPETIAREVMTPRVEVVALRAPVTRAAVEQAVRESGHSRFPVYEGSLDNLAGVLFLKDLFRSGGIRLRRPLLVPESLLVLDVLDAMRRNRTAFAVVVDEYGGVEGVITIKDIVRRLVGDLPDEFDRDEALDISRVDQSRWLIDGACPVDRVSVELDVDIPEGEYITLGGFLFERFGRIPDTDDVVEHDGWEFRVAAMDRRRIAQVVARAPSARMDRSDGL